MCENWGCWGRLPTYFISLKWICLCSCLPRKAMATHSSILAWKIPWKEETGRLQSTGSRRVGHDWSNSASVGHCSLSYIGEGNGNPLQCSCLENPRDRGAWWAAVYGVTQSWTQLKQLSSSSSRTCLRWVVLIFTGSRPLSFLSLKQSIVRPYPIPRPLPLLTGPGTEPDTEQALVNDYPGSYSEHCSQPWANTWRLCSPSKDCTPLTRSWASSGFVPIKSMVLSSKAALQAQCEHSAIFVWLRESL